MLTGDKAKDQKFLAQQFMAADENGDGVISFEEFKVCPPLHNFGSIIN